MIELVQLIAGGAMIIGGLFFLFVSVLGVYKFDYVLNRMHAAAMGDTLGILFMLGGLAVLSGPTALALKLILTVVMLWLTSPVSSHLIARLEVLTSEERVERYTEVRH